MHESNAVKARVRPYVARSLKWRGGPVGKSLSIGLRLCCRATISKPLNSCGGCTIVNRVMTAQSGSGPGPFEKFLLWLSTDRDLALKKYEEIRKKITRYFVRKGCPDPVELFSETRDRVIEIISGGEDYPDCDALFYSVARKVWLESIRKDKTEPLEVDPPIPDPEPNKELEASCLDTCLTRLPEADRDLITQYYTGRGREKIETRRRLA